MRVPSVLGHRSDVGFNMTPMIDIVFLLIIFFLVSSHLVRREAQMPLALPVAGSGEEAADDADPRVTLNVLPDGRILLAGHPLALDDLAGRLRRVRQGSPRDLEVRIRADRDVPYAKVSPILLAAAEAEIWHVTFAVYRDHQLAE